MEEDYKNAVSVIKPKKKWFDVDIKGLWHYKDLFFSYIKRDIVTRYKQTVLGPLWLFISPIFTTIVYMFVFGGLAGISTDGVPQPLFYMAGITLWTYFSSSFTACSSVFVSNAAVFGKVYFPRLIVPLSKCASNMINMAIQFSMFLFIYAYLVATGEFHFSFGYVNYLIPVMGDAMGWCIGLLLTIVATLVISLMAGLHAMSWGLIVTSFTTKYRDLTFLIGFGVQLLMYATPIIYPLSFASEKYRFLINLNPLTSLFEAFKYVLLGSGVFDLGGLLYGFVVLVVTLVLSVIIFNRTEQKFMDTV